jgi:hypothetical protein
VIVDRSALHKGPPVKSLTEGQNSTGGRNNHGRITSRFRGGGHKQAYRRIDFRRRKFDVPATVERLEYDPNRTGFIALISIRMANSPRLAPQRLAAGDTVVASEHADVKPGNAMPVANIPVGTIVHNVEIKIGKGGADRALCRQLRADRRPRPGLRDPATHVRAAPGAWSLHGDSRRRLQPGQYEHHDWQGRTPTLERAHAAQPRHHHRIRSITCTAAAPRAASTDDGVS